MADFSIWEVVFLCCFAVSWPVSIAKSLRTKVVIGKSPLFMSLIILGYIFGIIHKLLYSRDIVIWLYVFNALLVSFDLFLYFLYIKRNREQLKQNQNQLGPTLIFILRKFFGVILLAIAVNMFVNNISVIIAQVK